MNEVEFNVSNAELIVMRVIWSLGEARVDEIYAQIPQELEWSLATVKTLLGRLVKKEMLSTEKEGRKFGTFLTISSQRPSDISDTIISQLHNYFIHRLVNEEDLRKIHRTIAFSDKSTNDMISILPAGGCIFTGLASNFPVLARIDILPEANQPRSENVNISKIWY